MDANKRVYQFEVVSLNELVNEIMSNYMHQLESEGFDYELDLKPNIPTISADREAVSEAIINLIDNAIKYSDEKKNILISTTASDEWVSISVRDFGMGIPKKHHHEVFEQFFR